MAVITVVATTAMAWFILRPRDPYDQRPVVGLDMLLLAAPATGVADDPPRWTIESTRSTSAVNRSRRWSANGRAPELTQTVYRHASAADARHSLRADDPAASIARQFEREPSRVPSTLRLSASESAISCAASDREGCKIWVYWARYGQYTVAFDFFSIDDPVPLARFEAHIQAVDAHLAATFSSSTRCCRSLPEPWSRSWWSHVKLNSGRAILSDQGVPIETIAGTSVTEKVYRRQLKPVIIKGTETINQVFATRQSESA